jgi:hypothetical protein
MASCKPYAVHQYSDRINRAQGTRAIQGSTATRTGLVLGITVGQLFRITSYIILIYEEKEQDRRGWVAVQDIIKLKMRRAKK